MGYNVINYVLTKCYYFISFFSYEQMLTSPIFFSNSVTLTDHVSHPYETIDKSSIAYIISAAGAENFLLFTSSITGLETTVSNNHMILGNISCRIKGTGREVDYSSPPIA
jgi:hypothetical protein